MKKILSILLVSVLLIGCSENRVFLEDLVKKGNNYYFEGKLFNGIEFDIWDNGNLRYEMNFKNGKRDGLEKWWGYNGKMSSQNWINGKIDGKVVYY